LNLFVAVALTVAGAVWFLRTQGVIGRKAVTTTGGTS
jgi:hypothetical protein